MAAFRLLLTEKRDIVMKAKLRYTNGLDKLDFAESQVLYITHYYFGCNLKYIAEVSTESINI